MYNNDKMYFDHSYKEIKKTSTMNYKLFKITLIRLKVLTIPLARNNMHLKFWN